MRRRVLFGMLGRGRGVSISLAVRGARVNLRDAGDRIPARGLADDVIG
ncbi:hypothetical protein SAMN05443247_01469 [Bradyrhizobium erythrophlei]|jgi:hypothetical protein|nr:hypothetical protein SAMN05443247_01469 [Bradyrhizobium erythrophlei]